MAGGRRGVVSGMFLAFALASVASASTGPDDSARDRDWVAIGVAYGSAAAEEQGVSVFWDGQLESVFKFHVDAAGLAAGTWTLVGGGVQEVEYGGVSAIGNLDYDGGGTLGGDESSLVASGSVTTTGTIEPIGIGVDNTSEVGPLSIDVEVWCDEMWGTWQLTVEQAFEDAGFSGGSGFSEFDGTFIGHVRFVGFSDEALAELASHGIDPELLEWLAADYSIDERVALDQARIDSHLAAASAASQRLKDTYPNWAEADVYEAVNALHGLVNVLQNLSDCSRSILGEDEVETWIDIVNQSLERLIADLLELDLFSGEPVQPQGFATVAAPPQGESIDPAQASLAYLQLVDFATRSAVIGAGAIDQVAADRSEQALIDVGSRLLAGLDAVGGTPNDRRRVLLAGALMGWQFDIAGASVDAAASLAELGPTA